MSESGAVSRMTFRACLRARVGDMGGICWNFETVPTGSDGEDEGSCRREREREEESLMSNPFVPSTARQLAERKEGPSVKGATPVAMRER